MRHPLVRRTKTYIKHKIETTRVGRVIKKTPMWELMRPRRFHIFCVGAPKTGTTSIAQLFENEYRAQHEPGAAELVEVIEAASKASITRPELHRFLRERDREMRLELESSHPIAVFCQELVELFPRARFILTVRDCYSWLRSITDFQLSVREDSHYPAIWRSLSDIYHVAPGAHVAGERALEEKGLYTLDGYLGFWATHTQRVLDLVPEDRLLVLRTDRISSSLDLMASIAGIEAATLDTVRGHGNLARKKFRVVEQLDPGFLADKVDEHCRDLMQRFFPEMT